jgi:ectoine hydroxylase-related dioxygenase (phytanoyl-CoA dioxygenase family)|tara:strand:- start:1556 stop:2263 length:708 start_codon:yes stop_codon:yes gene_type:complete
MNYDIEKFHELGYVVVTDFLSEDEHHRLNKQCDYFTMLGSNLTNNEDGWILNSPNNPCKLDGAMHRSQVFRDLASNDTLSSIARTLLGQDNIDTYISKFFPMIPLEGFSVGWHQDNFYIKADPSKLISCDVFVNGADKENGCLRIAPNTHNKSFSHNTHSHGVFYWMSVDDEDPTIIDIEQDSIFAVFFHPNLVHSCYKNTSDRYRYSIAWEYIQEEHVPRTHNNHQSQDRFPVI